MDARIMNLTLGDIVAWLSDAKGRGDVLDLCRNTILCTVNLLTPQYNEICAKQSKQMIDGVTEPASKDDAFVTISGMLVSNRSDSGSLGATESELMRIVVEQNNLSPIDVAMLSRKPKGAEQCTANLRSSVSKIRKALPDCGCLLKGGADGVYGPLITTSGRPTDIEFAATKVQNARVAWMDRHLSAEDALVVVEKALVLDSGCHSAHALRLEILLATGRPAEEIIATAHEVRLRREAIGNRIAWLRQPPSEEWMTCREVIRRRLLMYTHEYEDLLTLGIMTEMQFQDRVITSVDDIEFKEMYESILRHRRNSTANTESSLAKLAEHPVVQRVTTTVSRIAFQRARGRGASVAYEDVAGISEHVVYRHVIDDIKIEMKNDLDHVFKSCVKACWPKAYVAVLVDYLSETERTVRQMIEKWRFMRTFQDREERAPTDHEIQSTINATAEEMGRIERAEAKLGGEDRALTGGTDTNGEERTEEVLLTGHDGRPVQLTDQVTNTLVACLRDSGFEGQAILERWVRETGALLLERRLPSQSDIVRAMPDIDPEEATALSKLVRRIHEIAGTDEDLDA